MHAHPRRRAAVAAEEIRGDARFVEEDQPVRVPRRRHVLPGVTRCGDVGTIVFGGAYGFF